MNRGVSQMMEEGPPAGFWRLNDMRPQFTQIMSSSPLLPSSSSSSSSSFTNASTTSGFPRQYSTLPSNSFPSNPWHDSQDLPESWSQLLLGGYIGEEEKGNFPSFLGKLENWDHVELSNLMNVKHESSETNRYNYGENCDETQQATTTTTAARSSWSQHMLPVSSPSPMSSCITSFNTNILDFSNTSNNNVEGTHHPRTECDSTESGSSFKKARIQASSTPSTFKVRKEKLGDRITVLHQLVSPFGKTDTASVLLEAIGYIRFLHGQIEALSSPYLGNALGNTRHHSVPQGERSCIFPEDPGQLLDDACIKRRGTCNQKDASEEAKKDLKSRGLCLVPISCTLHVETGINGADYWAPASLGGGLR